MRSLYLLQASGFSDAHAAALKRAKLDEKCYRNADGDLVEWSLIRIETLDWMGPTIEDGREVYSEPGPRIDGLSAELGLHPESFEPTQTGV